MNQKVVITGITGFIGSHLAEKLLEQGYEVHGISRAVTTQNMPYLVGVTMHAGDITDAPMLADVFAGAQYVFHLVALADQQCIDEPLEGERVNVSGTLNVLQAARTAGVKKVVFSSSASVYGAQERVPFQEDLPATPVDPFGLYKYFGERMLELWARAYGVPGVSLRIFNAYGPRDPIGPDAFVMGRFLDLRRKGQPLTIDGDGTSTRDYIYVSDIVAACIKAAESAETGHGEVLNIGTGIETSLNELALAIGGEIVRTDSRPGFRTGPSRRVADISRAKKLLDWKPGVNLSEGVQLLKAELGITV